MKKLQLGYFDFKESRNSIMSSSIALLEEILCFLQATWNSFNNSLSRYRVALSRLVSPLSFLITFFASIAIDKIYIKTYVLKITQKYHTKIEYKNCNTYDIMR